MTWPRCSVIYVFNLKGVAILHPFIDEIMLFRPQSSVLEFLINLPLPLIKNSLIFWQEWLIWLFFVIRYRILVDFIGAWTHFRFVVSLNNFLHLRYLRFRPLSSSPPIKSVLGFILSRPNNVIFYSSCYGLDWFIEFEVFILFGVPVYPVLVGNRRYWLITT